VNYVFLRRIDDDSSDSGSETDTEDVKPLTSFRCGAGKWGKIFRIYCGAKFHPLDLATSRGALIITGSFVD
jgi:hypothetical protein